MRGTERPTEAGSRITFAARARTGRGDRVFKFPTPGRRAGQARAPGPSPRWVSPERSRPRRPTFAARGLGLHSSARIHKENAMSTVLTAESTREMLARLAEANERFARAYPGEPADRQPVHTVYGGAHLFRADLTAKMGAAARRSLEEYAPDAASFAGAIALAPALAEAVYTRVVEKL